MVCDLDRLSRFHSVQPAEVKSRTAVVLSTRNFNLWGLTVLAMITSAARQSRCMVTFPSRRAETVCRKTALFG